MSKVTITKDNFDAEVLKSEQPVLVDFWAEWCGPCKIVEPIVEELAKTYEGKIKVGSVNVDNEQELAMQYQVMSIPTFIIFKNGQPVSQFIGAQPKVKFEEEINKVLL